jgi:16S rRNA (guanine527-N7)-methyltransferase
VFHVEHSRLVPGGEAALSDPRTILDAGLTELGLSLTPAQRDQLVELASLVERWNERINLSGHRTAGELMARLVLDALALSQQLPSPVSSLVDLGSGAGFPGLPLAIARPEMRTLLVDSRERRHHFQRAALRALGTSNVRALRGRIEQIEPEPAQVVVAQAVSPPPAVLQAMVAWAEPGGLVVIPGSEQPPDPGSHPQLIQTEIRRYPTPLGGPLRSLWIGKRS